jgi:hypothetical protein
LELHRHFVLSHVRFGQTQVGNQTTRISVMEYSSCKTPSSDLMDSAHVHPFSEDVTSFIAHTAEEG